MSDAARDLLKSLEIRVAKGGLLFAEGETTRELYILLDGELEIRKGGRVIALVGEPDTYLGEMSTLLGVARTATAVAARDSRLIRVPESKVTDFIAYSPALGLKLATLLARRLQEMNVKYEQMLRSDAPESASAAAAMKRLTATPSARGILHLYCQSVGRRVTFEEVARHAACSASGVSRALLPFADAGLAKLEPAAVEFVETPDKSLRALILNWRPF